jgi:hypothetical protein
MPFNSSCEAVALDGKQNPALARSKNLDYRTVSNILWFPDSRRWVSLGWYKGPRQQGFFVIEQGLEPKQSVLRASLGVPRPTTMFPQVSGIRLLGFVGSDRILAGPSISLDSYNYEEPVRLCQFSAGPSLNWKEYTLPLPPGACALDMALSPDGKRLALIVSHYERPPVSPFQRLFGRWWPSPLPRPQQTIRLYTVSPEGKEWRTLGNLPAEGVHIHSYPFYNLQWLPDGKHLSFICQKALWTVPSAR